MMIDNDYLSALHRQTAPFVEHLKQIVEGVQNTTLCISELNDLVQQWCCKPLWLNPRWFETLTKESDFILTPEDSPVMASLTVWPANWRGVLHDYRTWSVVGCLFGEIENQQWLPSVERRADVGNAYLQYKETVAMRTRDVIIDTVEAIHGVDNPVEQDLSLSLHVYGTSLLELQRYQYHPIEVASHSQLSREEPGHFQLHPHSNEGFFSLASVALS